MVRRKSFVPLCWLPLLSLAFIVSLAGYSHGQVTTKAAESKATAESRSVQVGERFPNIELKDQAGEAFGLKKTLAKGPVVLVVYRSADW